MSLVDSNALVDFLLFPIMITYLFFNVYIDRLATEFLPADVPPCQPPASQDACTDEGLPQLVADALSVEEPPDEGLRKRYQSSRA